MRVAIPTELEVFVERVVQSGTFGDPAEVVAEALRLLERREQLGRDAREAVEQLDRGQYSEYDEASLARFQHDIQAEQRKRFPQDTTQS